MFTRRKFIQVLTSTSLITFITPANFVFSLTGENERDPVSPQGLTGQKFKFFNQYQSTVIKDLTSIIIPINETKLIDIGFKIDETASKSKGVQKLYTLGIQWLDYISKLIIKKERFLDLEQKEKIQLLEFTENSKISLGITDPSQPWTDIRVGKLFFNHLKGQTLKEFYTSEAGWKFVGFSGPPQWAGNPEYSKCSF